MCKRFLERAASMVRGIYRRAHYASEMVHCPVLFPWFRFFYEETERSRIHRLAFECEWRANSTLGKRIRLAAAAFFWPPVLFAEILMKLATYGGAVKNQFGIARGRQLFGLIKLALRENIAPSTYYSFHLFLPENEARSLSYIQQHEIIELLPRIHPAQDALHIDDKQLFYEHCSRHGIPTPEVTAIFRHGKLVRWYQDGLETLPRRDLFFKRADFHSGLDIERWSYDREKDVWTCGKRVRNEAGMLDWGRKVSERRTYLVQPRLECHEQLKPLAPNGICTVRVVTYCFPQGKPSLLMACTRMPLRYAYVDNFSAGGIAAPVDLESGRLGRAAGKDVKVGIWEHHPDTGYPIAGTRIPDWEQVLTLCLRAHEASPRVAFIGWDVALASSGPVMLEGNTTWSSDLMQISSGKTLGETVFSSCYLSHYHSCCEMGKDESLGKG